MNVKMVIGAIFFLISTLSYGQAGKASLGQKCAAKITKVGLALTSGAKATALKKSSKSQLLEDIKHFKTEIEERGFESYRPMLAMLEVSKASYDNGYNTEYSDGEATIVTYEFEKDEYSLAWYFQITESEDNDCDILSVNFRGVD